MKGTLGPGCHLLHGPGFPLDELDGTRLVHHRFRMHWQNDSLILGARGPSNRSFIPTYSQRSPNRCRGISYGETRVSACISFLRGRNEGAHRARSDVNDSGHDFPMIRRKFGRNRPRSPMNLERKRLIAIVVSALMCEVKNDFQKLIIWIYNWL